MKIEIWIPDLLLRDILKWQEHHMPDAPLGIVVRELIRKGLVA